MGVLFFGADFFLAGFAFLFTVGFPVLSDWPVELWHIAAAAPVPLDFFTRL